MVLGWDVDLAARSECGKGCIKRNWDSIILNR
jgi:hypothetical protein